MRLIKLAAYALFGYALYEFFRGMSQEAGGGGGGEFGGGGGGQQRSFGAGGGESGRATNMSGGGEGQSVSTLESDGGSVNRSVGRGVMTP